jgi:hypothetical protein
MDEHKTFSKIQILTYRTQKLLQIKYLLTNDNNFNINNYL